MRTNIACLIIVCLIIIIVIFCLLLHTRNAQLSLYNIDDCPSPQDSGSSGEVTQGEFPLDIEEITGDIDFVSDMPFEDRGISQGASNDPWLFVTSGAQFGKVNLETQQFVEINNTNTGFVDIAFDNTGRCIGLLFGQYTEVDISNGDETFITAVGPPTVGLCGGANGLLYAVNFNTLIEIDLTVPSATVLRSDITGVQGDCIFFRDEFYWSGFGNLYYKIAAGKNYVDLATSPFITIGGPTSPNTYGLGLYQDKLYGVSGNQISEVDPSTGVESNPFNAAGLGFVLGAAKFDEAVMDHAYLVTVGGFDESAFPITLTFEYLTVVYFGDDLQVDFPYVSAICQAGSSFTVESGFMLGASSGVNFHPL